MILISAAAFTQAAFAGSSRFMGRDALPSLTQEVCEKVLQHPLSSAAFPMERWKVTYPTRDGHDQSNLASGLEVLPSNAHASDIWVIYQHGTKLDRQDVPSRGSVEGVLAACQFAAAGVHLIAPDYVGLGDSPGFHPYLHAATEAGAARDLLMAVADPHLGKTVRVLIAGYSQGGHAAMALHQDLETHPKEGVRVLASAPMSGPYDLSGTGFSALLNAPEPYATTFFTSYLMTAYQDVYGDVWSDLGAVFLPQMTGIPELVRQQDEKSLKALLPALPGELLTETYLTTIKGDESSSFRKHLRDNDVFDWAPKAPTLIIYAGGDKYVQPQHATTAFLHMKSIGGQVDIFNVGDTLGHGTGLPPSLEKARLFFAPFIESPKKLRK